MTRERPADAEFDIERDTERGAVEVVPQVVERESSAAVRAFVVLWGASLPLTIGAAVAFWLPPRWGFGFMLPLLAGGWFVAGIALMPFAIAKGGRGGALRFATCGLVGLAGGWIALTLPERTTISTTVALTWPAHRDAAASDADGYFEVPGSAYFDGHGVFVRAVRVLADGSGVLLVDGVEFVAPPHVEEFRERDGPLPDGDDYWLTCPTGDGWWFVQRDW